MTGRVWAYVGAVLGGTVSIAANVAHSYVPPAGAAPGWRPHAGAVAGAVFWPVALLVAIEIMARVDWPAGRRWVAVRFGGLLPVAIVTAVVSYRHMSGLLTFYREDPLTARIGPLAVDGLMVMAAGALLALGARHGSVAIADEAGDEVAERTYEQPAAALATAPDLALDERQSSAESNADPALDERVGERPGLALVGTRPRARRGARKVLCEHCGKRVAPSTRRAHMAKRRAEAEA